MERADAARADTGKGNREEEHGEARPYGRVRGVRGDARLPAERERKRNHGPAEKSVGGLWRWS